MRQNSADGDQREADPVERTARGPDGRRAVRDQQESGSRQRHRNDAEEDPCPGLAVEQPPLQRRGDRRGGDDRPHREQGLKDRLAGSRIGEEDDRLARDKQCAAGEALDDAERDQQVQPGRDGGNGRRPRP